MMPKPELLQKMNLIRSLYGKPLKVNSAMRCAEHNSKIPGAAVHSKHMLGEACDFHDPDGELTSFVLPMLEELDLWVEDRIDTPRWLHIQVSPYGSWKEGKSRVYRR
jgi:hypothetical protein